MANARRIGVLLLVAVGFSVSAITAQTCPEPWSLEEKLRIGSLSDEDALSGVLDLSIGPDGRLYVAQVFLPAVTVFDESGRPSHRIGRAGSGPGEFDGWPVRLGWLGDTLWVSDHGGLNYFGPNGEPLGQVYFHEVFPAEASSLKPWRPFSDGTYLPRQDYTSAGGGSGEAYFEREFKSLLRVSAAGEVVGRIGRVRNKPQVGIPSPFGGTAYTDHPLGGWGPNPYFAVTPDGSSVIIVGEIRADGQDAAFDLLRISVTGDTLMHESISYEPREISRSDRAWLREEFGNLRAGEYDLDSGPSPFPERDAASRERDRREGMEAITLPEVMPPVRHVLAGRDGSIWVLRELDIPDRVDRWEVYSADAELEGEVLIESRRAGAFPWYPRLEVLSASREEVWGVTLGEFDEPYIHRFQVVSGCR